MTEEEIKNDVYEMGRQAKEAAHAQIGRAHV